MSDTGDKADGVAHLVVEINNLRADHIALTSVICRFLSEYPDYDFQGAVYHKDNGEEKLLKIAEDMELILKSLKIGAVYHKDTGEEKLLKIAKNMELILKLSKIQP